MGQGSHNYTLYVSGQPYAWVRAAISTGLYDQSFICGFALSFVFVLLLFDVFILLGCFGRELYLDGNNLQCEGAMEIIKLCADNAELEAYLREEQARLKEEEEALQAEKGDTKDSVKQYIL